MTREENIILGIDVGASGMKGGLVDVEKGEMISERFRLDTPRPSTPEAMAITFREIVSYFNYEGPIGVGFPAIIRDGVALSAANIDPSWIGCNVQELFSKMVDCPVYVVNDADAAGVAVMHYGIGRGEMGVVIFITIGSGLGSALFIDGKLVPNTEFGHLYLKNKKKIAEYYASSGARKREILTWEVWGRRFNKFLSHINLIFSPQLIILGGGDSKSFAAFGNQLNVGTRVIPAGLQNLAGIIGAAVYAKEKHEELV